ncbi:MAG TPA: hypothetical protein PKA03_09545 [Tabrizicola sp.]|nr:hypothetical protein [Tabrizicola sp.]
MIDGIYTAYLTGIAGQGIAMFVFKDGKISGADMSGLTFSGSFKSDKGRIVGNISYVMPAGSVSITGASFEKASGKLDVPIDLPETLDPLETYRVNTPIGPLNAKFIKNVGF